MEIMVNDTDPSEQDMHAGDEAAIRAVIDQLPRAWAAGDGEAFASVFAEDADFTVWNGIFEKGRGEIAAGHQQIFDTFYKDTKLGVEIRSVRFLREDVAVVHAEGRVFKGEEDYAAAPLAVPVCVLVKDEGRWRIAVFHNTRVETPR